MKSFLRLTGILFLTILVAGAAFAASVDEDKAKIDGVLTGLHDAAAKADGPRYFSLWADQSVFFGTDATERWTLEQFKEWAVPYFAKGKGWAYTKIERNIFVDAAQNTAWFDERLMNEKYGECRGTGVLIKVKGDWKFTQYNLIIPIPNSIALDVVKMIQEATKKPK